MTNSNFELPPQCRNCTGLRTRVEQYFAQVDDFNNAALDEGITSGRLELAAQTAPAERKAAAAYTEQRLEAAAFIAERLENNLQIELTLTGIVCEGTNNPDSPDPQPCHFIQSVLD